MTQFENFKKTLEELFMLDQAELDFGIYRIMNQKRSEINRYLDTDLVRHVREVLESNAGGKRTSLGHDIEEAKKGAIAAGYDPETSPKVVQLRKELAELGNAEDLEAEVFSHLATFFRRYYDSGDFISQRRYKKDVYAIPYEGEEVKLYWANADQYYIKTSEFFRNYSFKLSDGKRVIFDLREASTEQNNNKTQGDKVRRFAIASENPVEVIGDELHIGFTYEPYDKKVKQPDLMAEAFAVIKPAVPATFAEVFALRATEKNSNRTLIEKHLNDYVSRNTFDYFIHKDLRGFLSRELDFYIKNEILFIDDIDARSDGEFLKYLSTIKAVKAVGVKIIEFLSSLEDFQKKLWLKKKFVVEANYCITLDRVPADLYPDIAANDAQREEWVRLFAIDEIKATSDLMDGRVAYSKPLSVKFLEENKFLVLDTAFFSDDFKQRLLAQIDDIDAQSDGLLISSENFQALNLLQEKYKEQVKCIYVDPPYNTSASEIIYKNEYKDSSWLSLMNDRIKFGKALLNETGVQCTTIDDVEHCKLNLLLSSNFNSTPETVAIRIKPSGRPIPNGFAISHEYALFSKANDDIAIQRLSHNTEQSARYRERDDNGSFFWEMFRKAGSNSFRENRPTMYYPFFLNETTKKLRMPDLKFNNTTQRYDILEDLNAGEIAVWPTKDDGGEGCWYFGVERTKELVDEFKAVKQSDGGYYIYYRRRPNEGVQPSTFWEDSKYSATEHGTALLKKIFGEQEIFSYPKSIFAVEDCLKVSGAYSQSLILDFFAGSGTTGHAVINLNRDDEGNRRYILVEMGEYFDTVTKPRIQKVIYSKDWKAGKPVSREGSSHCFKYLRLESYEDTLNNLVVKEDKTQRLALGTSPVFGESFLLGYMLDAQTRDSLFNTDWFRNPFDMSLNITRGNETTRRRIDLVETFNYLIGLNVEAISWPREGICTVVGTTRNGGSGGRGEKTLVIWRDCEKIDNAKLDDFFRRSAYSARDNEFDRIYVNGDSNIENLRTSDDHWKVVLTEEEFSKRMFEM